jgi:ElaB/YqjD/DUF883 family membrane-anchored ribosome-binding protein
MARRSSIAKTGKSEKSTKTAREDVEKSLAESQVNQASKTESTPASVQEDPLYQKLEEAGEKLKAVFNDVSEKANEIEKKFQNQITQAGDTVKKEIADAEGKIRENPLIAVGIAAGFGILIGLLLNRNK